MLKGVLTGNDCFWYIYLFRVNKVYFPDVCTRQTRWAGYQSILYLQYGDLSLLRRKDTPKWVFNMLLYMLHEISVAMFLNNVPSEDQWENKDVAWMLQCSDWL